MKSLKIDPSRSLYEPAKDALGLEIQAALKVDKAAGGRLRNRGCEPGRVPEFDCYCAASAGAYFFLKGEELAAFDALAPADTVDWENAGRAARNASYRSFCSDGGDHWWLERRQDDSPSQVIDLNIGVNDPNDDFAYDRGHGQGFQRYGYKRPSPRALEIIKLVKRARADGEVRHLT